MTTETVLTNEQIEGTIEDIAWPNEEVMKFAVEVARAIEQDVLHSEQVQAWKRDAERYQWLRDMIENQDLVIAKVGSWSLESWSGDDPDHYIDAAMEQQA